MHFSCPFAGGHERALPQGRVQEKHAETLGHGRKSLALPIFLLASLCTHAESFVVHGTSAYDLEHWNTEGGSDGRVEPHAGYSSSGVLVEQRLRVGEGADPLSGGPAADAVSPAGTAPRTPPDSAGPGHHPPPTSSLNTSSSPSDPPSPNIITPPSPSPHPSFPNLPEPNDATIMPSLESAPLTSSPSLPALRSSDGRPILVPGDTIRQAMDMQAKISNDDAAVNVHRLVSNFSGILNKVERKDGEVYVKLSEVDLVELLRTLERVNRTMQPMRKLETEGGTEPITLPAHVLPTLPPSPPHPTSSTPAPSSPLPTTTPSINYEPESYGDVVIVTEQPMKESAESSEEIDDEQREESIYPQSGATEAPSSTAAPTTTTPPPPPPLPAKAEPTLPTTFETITDAPEPTATVEPETTTTSIPSTEEPTEEAMAPEEPIVTEVEPTSPTLCPRNEQYSDANIFVQYLLDALVNANDMYRGAENVDVEMIMYSLMIFEDVAGAMSPEGEEDVGWISAIRQALRCMFRHCKQAIPTRSFKIRPLPEHGAGSSPKRFRRGISDSTPAQCQCPRGFVYT